MNSFKLSWKQVSAFFLTLAIIFTSLNFASLITANTEGVFANDDNVEVALVKTLGKDGVEISLQASAKQEGVTIDGFAKPDETFSEGSALKYVANTNATYNFTTHYTINNEKKSLSFGVVVDEITSENTPTNEGGATAQDQGVAPLTDDEAAQRNALLEPLASTGIELNMSILNNPRWDETQYSLWDVTKKSFSMDLKYYPSTISGTGRKLVVKIPKNFAFNLPSIVNRPGDLENSTTKIEVDYATEYLGVIDGVDTFKNNPGKDYTTITFYLPDVANSEDIVPISLELPIVQDYAAIAAAGKAPSVKYEFSATEAALNDKVVFDVPFSDEGITVKTNNSDHFYNSTNTDGAMTYTYGSYFPLLEDRSGDVKKLKDINLTFSLSKDKSSVPLDSFEVNLPLPKGYVLRESNNYKISIPKGGSGGANVTLSGSDWYTYDKGTNTVKIKLTKTQAEDLLTSTKLYGDNIGTFMLSLVRVDNSNKEFNKDTSVANSTNVLPFSFDGESLVGEKIGYSYEKLNGAGTTKVDKGSLTITLPSFTHRYGFYYANLTEYVTQNAPSKRNSQDLAVENGDWSARIYKDAVVTYDFTDAQKDGLNILETYDNIDVIKGKTKIKVYYADKDGNNTGVVDITNKITTDNKLPKLKFSDVLPANREVTKIVFEHDEHIMFANGNNNQRLGSRLPLILAADTTVSGETLTTYGYSTFSARYKDTDGSMVSTDLASGKRTYVLEKNNSKPTVTVQDSSPIGYGVRKILNGGGQVLATGSLAIPINTPSMEGSVLEITGDDAISLVGSMQFSGNLGGKVVYTVNGDAAEYEAAIPPSGRAMFDKVDLASNKYVTSIKVVFDGLDLFNVHKYSTWTMHPIQNAAGEHVVADVLPTTKAKIADGTTYQLSSYFVIPGVEQGKLPNSSGKTFTFIDANQYLAFNEGAMNYSDENTKITVDRTYNKQYASIAIDAPGKYTAIYKGVTWSVDSSTNDAKDMLSQLGYVKVGYTKTVSGTNTTMHPFSGTFNYKVFNPDTNTIESRTKAFTANNPNTVVSFDLADGEYITDLSMETDAFDNVTEQNAYSVGMEFYFKNNFVQDKTPYGRDIRFDDSYTIPTQLVGTLENSTVKNHESSVTRTPQFKKPDSAGDVLDANAGNDFNNGNRFTTALLKSDFTVSTDPAYVFIEDNRTFTKPVLQWKLMVEPSLSDLKNSSFSMRKPDGNKFDRNIHNVVGGMKFTVSNGPAMGGTVEYDVFKNGALVETRTAAIASDVVFTLASDEYIDDIRVKVDTLKQFTVSQTFTVTYYLRDNKTVTKFNNWDITDGFHEDAKVLLTITEGSKDVDISSTLGSTVSFYKTKNQFDLSANTTIPESNWYYTNTPAGDMVGFTYTTYPTTQTYKNAVFKMSAEPVYQQAFTFAEGISITNPMSDGKVVYKVKTSAGTEETREIAFTKGANLAGNAGDFALADDEYVLDVKVELDEIVPNMTIITGTSMGVYLRTVNPLGDKARNDKVVKPAEQYAIDVQFNADNYNPATGIKTLADTPGQYGESHYKIKPITATFGTFEVKKDPENYKVYYTSTKKGVEDDVDGTRNIYQGANVTFEHTPTMAWKFYRGIMPSNVNLDNPKVYYIVDTNFNYVPGSLEFKDPSGAIKTPEVKYYTDILASDGRRYGIIEATFYNSSDAKTSYHFDMGTDEGVDKAIGDVTFKLKASQVNTGDNITAVYGSWVEFGHNIATDPTNYTYSHQVDKYQIAPVQINPVVQAPAAYQYLPLGEGGKLNIKKNTKLGIMNEASTPSERGLSVSGSDVTKFSHDITLTPAAIDSHNVVMYIPLSVKGDAYTYEQSGVTKTLNPADFTFNLTGPVTINNLANGGSITNPAGVQIMYGGSKSGGTAATQAGLSGDIAGDVGYEAYNAANAADYTMIRVVVPTLKRDTDILSLNVPMEYAGNKTVTGTQVNQLNVQAGFSKTAGSYSNGSAGERLNGSDLTYTVKDYKISGYMWKDTNNNGQIDDATTDPRWANETVSAKRTVDSTEYTYTATTDANGYYEITVPGGGDYSVKFPDKFTGKVHPNAWNFVVPNAPGVTATLSSKPANDATDLTTYGIAPVSIADSDVNSINAGYFQGLPDDALIEDIVLWVNESGMPVFNNPNNLDIKIPLETLKDSSGTDIATVAATGLVTGINPGVVHKSYSYPNGLGGTETKTFKITVKPKFLVTYVVEKDKNGAENGVLTPKPSSPDGLIETIKDGLLDNKVQYFPTQKANDKYAFDGWYYDDDENAATAMVSFDPSTVQITRNTTVYARFDVDDNEDNIPDKYQVKFTYMTNDTNGNAVGTPNTEWVTRYVDANLPAGTGVNQKDHYLNWSKTASVSPKTVPAVTANTAKGYRFDKWKDDQADKAEYTTAKQITDKSFAAPSGKVVFEAFFALDDYTVNYVTDGHGSLTPHTDDVAPLLEEQVVHGNTVAQIPTPVNEVGTGTDPDYVFDGWYWDHDNDTSTDDIIFEPTTPITRNSTVIATFAIDTNKDGIADKYQVQFSYKTNDKNGNTVATPNIEWVTRYEDTSLPAGNAPGQKDYYTNLSKDKAVSPTTVPAVSVNTAAGYHFDKWKDDQADKAEYTTAKQITDKSFAAPSGKVVFEAFFSLNDYTVNYVTDGHGSLKEHKDDVAPLLEEQVVHGGTVAQMPTPVNEVGTGTDPDYVFDGWYWDHDNDTSTDDIIFEPTTPITRNSTVIATFAIDTNKDGIADKYQVQFSYKTNDKNGNKVATPNIEWVTRYEDTSLPAGNAPGQKDYYTNLSKDKAVSPTTVPAVTANTAAGYHFDKWKDDQADKAEYTTAKQITDKSFAAPSGKVVFEAFFALNDYTVNYITDGNGDLTPHASDVAPLLEEQVVHGNTVAQMPTPVNRVGTGTDPDYVFDGWYWDADNDASTKNIKFDPTTPITRDSTVIATFAIDTNKDGIADKYQVKFTYMTNDANGNGDNLPTEEWITRYNDPSLTGAALNALENLSQTASVKPVTVPTPNVNTAAGYHFDKWVDDQDASEYTVSTDITDKSFTAPTGEVEFEAFFELNDYTVKYITDGHGSLTAHADDVAPLLEEQVIHGNTVAQMPTPVNEVGTGTAPDYVFDGWYWDHDNDTSTANIAFNPTTPITRNATVIATFAIDTNKDGIADKYQVEFTYMTNDAKGNGKNLPVVEWVTRYEDTGLPAGTAPGQKDHFTNLSTTKPVSPTTVPVPELTVGYHFVKWVDNQDASEYTVATDITGKTFAAPSGKVVFEAFFLINTYTVDYVTDGHGSLTPHADDVAPLLEEPVNHGSTVQQMPTPVNEINPVGTPDYVFDGWVWDDDEDASTDNVAFDPTTPITRDTTVIATYTPDENKDGVGDKYQVIFKYTLNPHGEFEEGEEVYEEYVNRDPITSTTGSASPTNVPTPVGTDGYVFTNWEVVNEVQRTLLLGVGTTYGSNDDLKAISTSMDTTFVAVFHKAPTIIDDALNEAAQEDIEVIEESGVYHVEATTKGSITREVNDYGKLYEGNALVEHLNTFYKFKGNGILNDKIASAKILEVKDEKGNVVSGVDERVAGTYIISLELINEDDDMTIATITYVLTPKPIIVKPSQSPKTGDATDANGYVSMLALALVLIVAARRYNKHEA